MNMAKSEVEIERLKRFISDKDQYDSRAQRLSSLVERLDGDILSSEVKIFKALADNNRLKIIKLLKEGELCA